MKNTDITKFIISELSRQRRRDDIIKMVCEKTGMQWNDAQQFVQRVYAEHHNEITSSQNTLYIIIGVFTILGGLLLSVGMLIGTLSGWVILLRQLPVPYLGNLFFFGTGILMIAGGIMGLVKLKDRR